MVGKARFYFEVVRFHVDASPVAGDKYIIGKIRGEKGHDLRTRSEHCVRNVAFEVFTVRVQSLVV